MRLRILILIFIIVSALHAKCLTKQESDQLIIEGNPKDFDYIPNYIQCNDTKSNLEKFVCNHPDYFIMFHYLSQVNVYKYEDIYKHEVNHHNFNKKSMAYWKIKYKEINANHLCFDLKESVVDILGLQAPYKIVNTKEGSYFIQENKHGAVLTDREGYKIYMGKDCDVMDSKKQKGSWYRENDQYIIKLGKEKIGFDFSDLNLKNYKCIQK